MHEPTDKLKLTVLTLALVVTGSAARAETTLEVAELPRAPTVADFAGMRPSSDLVAMPSASGFVQRTPQDGRPASQRTTVYAGYDREKLYFVFVAFDDQPELVRARLSRREQIGFDDQVRVLLDTFQDQRRAFAFAANPFGVQWDATWAEGQGYDRSFDTVWESDGMLTDSGYVVLMAIPFKSLRFRPQESQRWGVVFARNVPRDSVEETTWPRVSSQVEGWLNQAGTLSGLSSVSPGRNLQLITYGSFRGFELLDEDQPGGPRFVEDDADFDAGVDLKAVIDDRLVADVTVNPDFSQVESDLPQVTVNQRFEVFFPERRPFFLENADFFQTPLSLLFTRRIGDPKLGGRLTGKLGPWGLGALLIDDEAPGQRLEPTDPAFGDEATYGVLRLTRDIVGQSRVGLLYARREFDRRVNEVTGADARIKWSDRWVSSLQGVRSETRDSAGAERAGEAGFLSLSRSGRRLNLWSTYTQIDPDFEADAGFIPRTDMRRVSAFGSYWFWPDGNRGSLIRWGPELFVQRLYSYDGQRLDDWIEPSLEWEFPGRTQVEINYGRGRVKLRPRDFPALNEDRDFDIESWVLELGSSRWSRLSISGNLRVGRRVNFNPPAGKAPALADWWQGDARVVFRPSHRVRLEHAQFYTRLDDERTGDEALVNSIARSTLNLQFTRELSVRVILQYEDTDSDPAHSALESGRNLNADLLVTYRVNPWTALFVGYNDNARDVRLIRDMPPVVVPTSSLHRDARQLFAKFSYLFRY